MYAILFAMYGTASESSQLKDYQEQYRVMTTSFQKIHTCQHQELRTTICKMVKMCSFFFSHAISRRLCCSYIHTHVHTHTHAHTLSPPPLPLLPRTAKQNKSKKKYDQEEVNKNKNKTATPMGPR